MKQKYIIPTITVCRVATMPLLAAFSSGIGVEKPGVSTEPSAAKSSFEADESGDDE